MLSRSSGFQRRLDNADATVTHWMARHGVNSLRISLGVILLWFGALKLFPGLSPAEGLAGHTIQLMTGGIVDPWLSVPVLGICESLIGLGLLTGRALRVTFGCVAVSHGRDGEPRLVAECGVRAVAVRADHGGAVHHQEHGVGEWSIQ